MTPATLVSGPDPGEAARRAATIGVQAFADAVFRRYYSGVDRGPGLRGGRFTASSATSTRCATSASPPTSRVERGRDLGRLDRRRGARTLTIGAVQMTAEWTQLTPLATVRVGDAVLSTPAP